MTAPQASRPADAHAQTSDGHPAPADTDPAPADTLAPSTARLFRFAQVEVPWTLGPPDGRYLLRPDGQQPTHVVVLATLGAIERRRLTRRRRSAPPNPQPAPVPVTRATVIDVAAPFRDRARATAWLKSAGLAELDEALVTLNRVLHAFRLVSADPAVNPVARHVALVARLGYGEGEQVADGAWSEAVELVQRPQRTSRAKVLTPQARLAAVLAGRERALACEELILRARLDLDHGRGREAALQLLVALDAALAELAGEPRAAQLAERLAELAGHREAVAQAAQAALGGPLDASMVGQLEATLRRLEAALRARAVMYA